MLFVANVPVEWVTLPKLPCTPQNLIALVRGEIFPRMRDLAHRETGFRREQSVRVIGHYTPGMTPINAPPAKHAI